MKISIKKVLVIISLLLISFPSVVKAENSISPSISVQQALQYLYNQVTSLNSSVSSLQATQASQSAQINDLNSSIASTLPSHQKHSRYLMPIIRN
ncbi:hypothetical protein HY025_03165 [Candidatus Daviesbacteria bacterium]|nr:hypothetical protein [Candidatus Daviesbacteria bacterium]